MLRKILLGSGALALATGLTTVAGATVAGAMKSPVTMTGVLNCSTSGHVKFSPALTNGGSTPTVANLKVGIGGCTGSGTTSGAVTLTGGNLLASTSPGALTSDCGPVLSGSPALPAFSGTIKWKASGGQVVASAVTVANAALYYNQGADTLTAYLTTVTITSGSFAGETVHMTSLVSSKDALKMDTSCGTNGLKAVPFGTPRAPVGTVSVGA